VVYDGRQGILSTPGAPSSVGTIFTQGESADDRIKRMLEKAENPRNIVVVTNDREIQRFARQKNAQVKSVEEFLVKCAPPKPKGKEDDKIIGPFKTAEINEEMKKIWLK
jgi:predicted RNA-binding protein with PIN domain